MVLKTVERGRGLIGVRPWLGGFFERDFLVVCGGL
jgi:hypothetical protein